MGRKKVGKRLQPVKPYRFKYDLVAIKSQESPVVFFTRHLFFSLFLFIIGITFGMMFLPSWTMAFLQLVEERFTGTYYDFIGEYGTLTYALVFNGVFWALIYGANFYFGKRYNKDMLYRFNWISNAMLTIIRYFIFIIVIVIVDLILEVGSFEIVGLLENPIDDYYLYFYRQSQTVNLLIFVGSVCAAIFNTFFHSMFVPNLDAGLLERLSETLKKKWSKDELEEEKVEVQTTYEPAEGGSIENKPIIIPSNIQNMLSNMNPSVQASNNPLSVQPPSNPKSGQPLVIPENIQQLLKGNLGAVSTSSEKSSVASYMVAKERNGQKRIIKILIVLHIIGSISIMFHQYVVWGRWWEWDDVLHHEIFSLLLLCVAIALLIYIIKAPKNSITNPVSSYGVHIGLNKDKYGLLRISEELLKLSQDVKGIHEQIFSENYKMVFTVLTAIIYGILASQISIWWQWILFAVSLCGILFISIEITFANKPMNWLFMAILCSLFEPWVSIIYIAPLVYLGIKLLMKRLPHLFKQIKIAIKGGDYDEDEDELEDIFELVLMKHIHDFITIIVQYAKEIAIIMVIYGIRLILTSIFVESYIQSIILGILLIIAIYFFYNNIPEYVRFMKRDYLSIPNKEIFELMVKFLPATLFSLPFEISFVLIFMYKDMNDDTKSYDEDKLDEREKELDKKESDREKKFDKREKELDKRERELEIKELRLKEKRDRKARERIEKEREKEKRLEMPVISSYMVVKDNEDQENVIKLQRVGPSFHLGFEKNNVGKALVTGLLAVIIALITFSNFSEHDWIYTILIILLSAGIALITFQVSKVRIKSMDPYLIRGLIGKKTIRNYMNWFSIIYIFIYIINTILIFN